jgi:hypothetical protein
VGAIAAKTRDGGGHVFLVVGRTKDGRLVGRGGNQRDMVCDEVFDPSVVTAVAAALRDELGDCHRGIKIVMRWTGAASARPSIALPARGGQPANI